MNDKITLEKVNNTYLRVITSEDINEELSISFTFLIENARHHPLVKARKWDGKIRMYKKATRTMYIGLIGEVQKFAKERGYDLVITKELSDAFLDTTVTQETFTAFIKNLKMYDLYHQEKMKWRDYQLLALWNACRNKRRTIVSATGTGKSAFIYAAIRYFQENTPLKILLVTGTVGLVEQMYSDFSSYAHKDEDWLVEENCDKMYSGQTQSGNQILISTWQSLMNMSGDYFSQFGAVLVDECHGVQAKELSAILENCTNAEYRIGTTGTLNGIESTELSIKGLLGPVIIVQSAKQGMDNGWLANLNIDCKIFNYPKELKKTFAKLKYQDEIEYIFNFKPRNDYICDFVSTLEGNSLLLFSRIEHGKALQEYLVEKYPNRNVHLIYGNVEAMDRENIRHTVEKAKNDIIVASYGTMSVGVNLRNLNNVIFCSPSKSLIRVLQSIGRGLRKTAEKTECKLYDFVDNMTGKNYAYIHFIERAKIYEAESFKYKIEEINL